MPDSYRFHSLHPGNAAFAVISAVTATFTAVLSQYRPALFRPFFADTHPLFVILVAIVVGGICLAALNARARFATLSPEHDSFWPYAVTVVPTLLAAPAIAADALIGFPRNMNVLAPQSLLFYPAIGYVAEVAFHLVPLTLFLFIVTVPFRVPATNKVVWAGLLVAAITEPVFQVAFSLAGHPFTVLEGFVGVHLVMFSAVAVWTFRRYDFVTMYLFRLVYYLWWHIAWGTIRLHLLF